MGYLTETLTVDMISELRTYCRNYLAFLTDEGFEISVVPMFKDSKCTISIISKLEHLKEFTNNWYVIKDTVIPFLIMLKQDYIILDNTSVVSDSIYAISKITKNNINDIISDIYFTNQDEFTYLSINVDFKK